MPISREEGAGLDRWICDYSMPTLLSVEDEDEFWSMCGVCDEEVDAESFGTQLPGAHPPKLGPDRFQGR